MGQESRGCEIPFRLRSSDPTVKWVSGIDDLTTCDDILASLFESDPRFGDRDVGHFTLVEKWRDVERPLNKTSKILKLWQAWGEEQDHVVFIVKRLKARASHKVASTSSTSERRHRRRRNSTSSTSSRLSDTWHPKKMDLSTSLSKARARSNSSLNHQDDSKLENMLQELVVQGKLIYQELAKIQSSPAGRNNGPASGGAGADDVGVQALPSFLSCSDSAADRDIEEFKQKTREISLELARLHALNEELQSVETKCHILGANLVQMRQSQKAEDAMDERLRTFASELDLLKQQNANAETSIEQNRDVIMRMDEEFSRKKELIKRLEYDVNVIEKEGRKMGKEYEKVLKLEIPDTLPDPSIESIYSELKELRLSHVHSTSESCHTKTLNESLENRILVTGSPEGSTSGVSSSSSAESPLKFSSKLFVNEMKGETNVNKVLTKTKVFGQDEELLTSDTGLSSLHSSSDNDEEEREEESEEDVETLV